MGLYQQRHCQYEPRKRRWDDIKEVFWTSEIEQDQLIELCDCKHALFFKKGKNDPKGNSDIITIPLTLHAHQQGVSSLISEGVVCLGFSGPGSPHPVPEGLGPPRRAMVTQGRSSSQREIFLSLKMQQNLPCQSLDFFRTLQPLSSSQHLPFVMGRSIPRLVPPQYFGTTELVWFHRFTTGKEFCLEMNHTSSLIYI